MKILLLMVAAGLSAQSGISDRALEAGDLVPMLVATGPGNGPGDGQDRDNDPNSRPALQRLGLTEAQITTVTEVWTRRALAVRTVRADLEIKQAQLARALVPANPDMNAVRTLLREAVDLEYQIRLNMMEGELEVRKAVGEEIWVKMVRGRDRDMMPYMRGGPAGAPVPGPRNDDRPGRG